MNYTAIVQQVYEDFQARNTKDNFKFSLDMVTLIMGNIFENDFYFTENGKDRRQTNEELIHTLDNCSFLNEITKFYLSECKKNLGDFDPRDIEKNLKKLNLL